MNHERLTLRRSAVWSRICLAVALGGCLSLTAGMAEAQTFPQDTEWVVLTQDGTPIGDPLGDSQTARDIVGDATNPAMYVYSDGTYLYFRMRIDGTVLQSPGNYKPFGWACAMDTDGELTSYELIAGVDGIANPDVVELLSNTQQKPDAPNDPAETLLASYPPATYAREAPATSTFGGDPDVFIDWAVKISDMTGVTATTALRFACGTSNNARSLAADLIGLASPTTLTGMWSAPLNCGAAGCVSCTIATACGPTCAACGGNTPFCDAALLACVACQSDTDCPASTPVCSPSTKACSAACTGNGDCADPTPVCDTASAACVGCLTDADCADPTAATPPTCNAATKTCTCTGGPAACADADGDGLSDAEEIAAGTNPNDADSDDDGVPDGQEPSFDLDSDGDGLINALDPDSDDDGLYDGTELGLDCSAAGTDVSQHHCVPDADSGATKTDPLKQDTDGGGASDGSEDANLNGAVDSGEQDPTTGHEADDTAVVDSDQDGLSDGLEATLGTDPADADSDDDGLNDGLEHNPADDTDGDGLINVLDPDSDNDAIFDGTEAGKACGVATNLARERCIADADAGQTTTSGLLADTDGGGATDGSEDANRNGVVDSGETDPVAGQGGDDPSVVDQDGDGLGDSLETSIGTDPSDADSDDDGLADGAEPNPSDDTDGDGLINTLDPDSDGDGLKDGTEAGNDCSAAAIDTSKGNCVADADPSTTTKVLLPDTDRGGVWDGNEDLNKNGRIDTGETDPNDPADDVAASEQGLSLEGGGCGCGVPSSGLGHAGWLAAAAVLLVGLRRRDRRTR